MRTVRAGLALLVGIALASACSQRPAADDDPSPHIPAGFEVPAGVALTDPGAELEFGDGGTVIYSPEDGTTTVITLRPLRAKKGSIKDFSGFSLDAESKKKTPYYVTVDVENAGPAAIGGEALPLYANTGTGVILPPVDLVGLFKPCRERTLPDDFGPGETAKACLVFMIPANEVPESFDFAAGDDTPIAWTVSDGPVPSATGTR